MKKLESSGIIRSYHATPDTEKVDMGVLTFVMVSLKRHNKKNIGYLIEEIDKIPKVIECHHITGSCDFILKVIAGDIQSYQKLMLEKVSEVVDSLQSMIILSTFKDSRVMQVFDNE